MKISGLSLSFVFASLLLTACGQSPSEGTAGKVQPAAPSDVSSRDFGDYTLHFNAMSTDLLTPEVARAYNIVRSKNRALLTVSINRKAAGTIGKSVHGQVSVRASNLTGQLKNLSLQEINEDDAVYYVGDLAVANGETLIFEVEAIPENETVPLTVKFSRRFYSN